MILPLILHIKWDFSAHPRCKNLSPSRVTLQNKENKEVKTKDRTNIIVTKQRKTSQVFTPR